MAEELNLSNLKPAQARKDRKRVGRGLGSGKGRYSGRGIKGQKSRSGSHKMRAPASRAARCRSTCAWASSAARLEGRDADRPYRTSTWSVNVRDLERFDAGAEVTPEALVEAGLIRNTKLDVKILGHGDLTKKLTVSAHLFSASAREKIEAAGGTRHVAARRAREAEAPGTRRPRRRRRDGGRRGRGRARAPTSRGADAAEEPEPRAASRARPRRQRRARCSPGSRTPGACRSSGAASSSPR